MVRAARGTLSCRQTP